MKKILKIFGVIICIIYVVIVMGLTTLLLCYNDYKVTEIFDNSLIIVGESLEPYQKNDLIVVKNNGIESVNIGDEILFYEVENGIATINSGKVTNVEVIDDTERTYTINDNHAISSESLIGKTADSKVYSDLGGVLGFLESRFGFLFLVILPLFLLFLYELYKFIIELKTPITDEE